MQFLTLIPSEAKVSIVVLFIITIAVLFLRISLYKKLEEVNIRIAKLLSGGDTQNTLVNKLRKRYEQASQKLEHVNTIALIDSVYKDETIAYGGWPIQFDRADGITKIWPNLLIAAGLIGTFIGITSNLTDISGIVLGFNKDNPDMGKLVQPLKGMGVAFSTSLVGLLFGSGLTIANTFWNTSLAKYQLLAGLEDYLDNIYKPTVEGNTRLDKAIDRMADKQQEFLNEFHQSVGKALEASFGKAAMQIADECSRINNIAERVYNNFSNAAEIISTGATTFEQAANNLQIQNQTLADSLQEFKAGARTFKLAANKIEQNNIVENLDRVLEELNTSQLAFTQSTQTLQNSLVGITSSNETAAKLAQAVYKTWQVSTDKIDAASEKIGTGAVLFQQAATSLQAQTQTVVGLVPQLQTGVDAFVTGAEQIKQNNIVKRLDTVVASLRTTQQAFADSTQTLATGVEEIVSSNLQATQLAQQVYNGLEMSTDGIRAGSNSFANAAHLIHESSLAVDLTAAAQSWQTAQAGFANLTTVFSQAAEKMQPVATKLEPAIAAIDKSIDGLQQFGKEVVILSQNTIQFSESTKAAISDNDRNYQKVLYSTELSVQNLNEINRSSWQELRNILTHRLDSTESSVQTLTEINRSSWQELRNILTHRTEADKHHNDRAIEALKEHITQMSLKERESLAKLLSITGKLESKLNIVDSADAYLGQSGNFSNQNKRN